LFKKNILKHKDKRLYDMNKKKDKKNQHPAKEIGRSNNLRAKEKDAMHTY
jgi:hypothetical protein